VSLLAAVLLLLGNAFFVGAQFALITARRDQLEPLAARGGRSAQAALAQLRSLPRMLAGSQLGIAACSLGLGAVAEPAFAHVLRSAAGPVHLPHTMLRTAAFVVALAFVSYAHMVLGEMVPKNPALAAPVRAALLLGRPMAVWVRVTRPILIVTNGFANLLLRLVHVQVKHELGGIYTADELADLFTESAAEGLIDPEEQSRLQAALRVEQTTAADLMIPMATLVTATVHTTAREFETLVASSGYSRFPVLREGRLLGYVHAKDILEIDEAADGGSAIDAPIPVSRYRAMVTVAPSDTVGEVVAALQGTRTHLCQVVAGRVTLGVIALDDVLLSVVGGAKGPSPRG
jgi:CBS domain containing-hemolysin-like protein